MNYEAFRHRSHFDYPELLAFAYGRLVEDAPPAFAAKLPLPPMLMVDRIGEIRRERHKGRIVAERDVRLDDWFFQCHFLGDPVQPGCFGVDGVWQLIGFFCAWAGGLGTGRALGCGEVEFAGQIRPHDAVMRYEIDIVRYQELPASGSAVAVGDATVAIDGDVIYTVKRAKVGIFRDIDYADYPWPSQALPRGADGPMSEGRVAVVTGGATGIGRAVCRALAAKGFRVGVVYNASEAKAREVADGLEGAFVARADLGDPAQIEALVKQLQDVAGRVDVLVNNAGYNRDAPIFSMKLEDYDAVAGLARGTWYLTKLVLRRFMLRTGGRVVNISSVVGHTGNAGQIPYTMAKAGLDAMTRSLSQELRGRDILVNSVAPGFIDTEMTASLPEEVRGRILERIPLGRMGRPEEVAEVVAFLATEGSYIHGSVLHVNGGMYGG